MITGSEFVLNYFMNNKFTKYKGKILENVNCKIDLKEINFSNLAVQKLNSPADISTVIIFFTILFNSVTQCVSTDTKHSGCFDLIIATHF